ncbi:hypothetical protein [Acinetobacter boissieri]|uniref:DUF1634 domain-containing protein n=1 Tax=Acinetobacter boissieri TaxID=1219383 RepID=A0A1G6IDW5_9GAMM|nr:hypothetical protein [Acinetobacter boissieri]SDC04729.1 hypothetical protein SAMN05421733_10884 [Acinetobacter boissieri]
MIIIFAWAMSYFSFYLLYLSSDKQKKIVSVSKLAIIAQKPRVFKALAFGLFFTTFILLSQHYSYSVAFFSFWIFATPLIFLLVLRNNQLKSKK